MDNKAFQELRDVAARSFADRWDAQEEALQNVCLAFDAIMEEQGPKTFFSYEPDETNPKAIVLRTSVETKITVHNGGAVDIVHPRLNKTVHIPKLEQAHLLELVQDLADLIKVTGKEFVHADGGRHRRPECREKHSVPQA